MEYGDVPREGCGDGVCPAEGEAHPAGGGTHHTACGGGLRGMRGMNEYGWMRRMNEENDENGWMRRMMRRICKENK